MKTINKFITQPKGSGNIALNFQISNNNILNEMIINANVNTNNLLIEDYKILNSSFDITCK